MSSTRGWTLAAAAAMSLGAAGLAPSVMRYWSARLGIGASGHERTARALKPPPSTGEVDDRPEPPRSQTRERSVIPPADATRREPAPRTPSDDVEPQLESEPGAELAAPRTDARTAEALPAAPAPHLPPNAHVVEPEPSPAPEAADESESPPAEEEPNPAPIRRVSITVLEARTHPGLCRGATDAVDAREVLVARFHAVSWDGAALLRLDPRLAPGVQLDLIADLEQAEREISRVLQLAPPRPDVFAYHDTQLLLAGACTNGDVVAYYDGALHVVPSHDDVAQSILHEYTHHALTAAGLLGPAWAQEGIAMHMAGETWWRGGWMSRVLERPFSLEVMESAVPYRLRSDQAGLFYAQSAAMVACAIQDDPRGLRGLVESLAAGSERGELSYQLPSAAAPLAWRSCFSDLAR